MHPRHPRAACGCVVDTIDLAPANKYERDDEKGLGVSVFPHDVRPSSKALLLWCYRHWLGGLAGAEGTLFSLPSTAVLLRRYGKNEMFHVVTTWRVPVVI